LYFKTLYFSSHLSIGLHPFDSNATSDLLSGFILLIKQFLISVIELVD
jgi:hypothetical protein